MTLTGIHQLRMFTEQGNHQILPPVDPTRDLVEEFNKLWVQSDTGSPFISDSTDHLVGPFDDLYIHSNTSHP